MSPGCFYLNSQLLLSAKNLILSKMLLRGSAGHEGGRGILQYTPWPKMRQSSLDDWENNLLVTHSFHQHDPEEITRHFPWSFSDPCFAWYPCQYIARTLQYPNQWEEDTATWKPRCLKQRPQPSEPATSWTHKNEQPNSQSQVFARLQLTTHSFVRNSSLHASNLGFCFWELYLLHIVIFLESLKSLCKCVGDSSWHISKSWKRWQTD